MCVDNVWTTFIAVLFIYCRLQNVSFILQNVSYILQNVNIVCLLTSSLSFSYYHCHAACSLRSHYQRLLYVGSL